MGKTRKKITSRQTPAGTRWDAQFKKTITRGKGNATQGGSKDHSGGYQMTPPKKKKKPGFGELGWIEGEGVSQSMGGDVPAKKM